jgi:arginase
MLSQHKKIVLIGAALGWGAKLHETELGADAYYEAKLAASNANNSHWHKIIYPSLRQHSQKALDYAQRLQQIHDFNQQLGSELQKITQPNQFCVTLGGDHSVAIGTWSGTILALAAQQQFGLLWIDAHLDSHTPDTSPSQAIHGMPLAVLLGYGEPALVNLLKKGPKLLPQHVVLFGIRSFEEEEAALLSSLKVRIYDMEEIRDRGIELCLQEAIQIVNGAPKGFGISIDLDAFDPIEAPGVGSPEPNGIFPDAFIPELKNAFSHPNLKALEIVEYNPTRDQDNKTLKLTQKILGLL